MINPDEFIITRKRKKYKFAKFATSPLCFELSEWKKRQVDVLEIGAGTGLFSVELASRYPAKIFTAIDVKADRLQKGAYEAEARGLKNINFVRMRADQLLVAFSDHSIDKIWLTFPDPFPKKRSAGRRMTHPHFLTIYQKLLAKRGTFYLKHDNPAFFQWSLEELIAEGWHIDELSFDLHESELSDDYKIMTSYEQRWLNEGLKTQFVAATPAYVHDS